MIAVRSGLVFDRWYWPIIQPLLTSLLVLRARSRSSQPCVVFETSPERGEGLLALGGDLYYGAYFLHSLVSSYECQVGFL